MNPLHVIWASSLIGALLFFCLGWAVSVLRRATAPVSAVGSSSEERTRWEQQLRTAANATAEAELACDESRRELEETRGQLAALQKRAGDGGRELNLVRENARLEVSAAHQERDKCREEAIAAAARVEDLEVQLRAVREGHQEHGGIVRELTALQARLSAEQKALRETRAQLEKAQRASAERADRQQRDLAREAEMEKLRGELREHSARCRLAEQKAAELGAGLAAADGEYRRLSERLAEAQQRATSVQTQHASAMAQVEELRSQAQRAGVLETENGRLQAELRASKSSTSSENQDKELVELRKAMHDAKLRLGAAQAKEGEVDRLRTEAMNLREQLGELLDLRAKAAELEQLRADHRTLRVDLAIVQRRCEEQQAIVSAHSDMERRMQELTRDADEASSLRQKLAALEPLALVQVPHSATRPKLNGGSRSPDDVLAAVRRTPGFRSVAIASNQGLLVHGDGLTEHWEALAATGGLVSRFIENVLSLLPLGSIQMVHVHGAHNTSLSCWMSGDENEPLVMTALGVGAPVAREVWQNVANPIHTIQVA